MPHEEQGMPLTADQLRAVKDLVVDPLVDAVCTRLDERNQAVIDRFRTVERDIDELKKEVSSLKSLKAKMFAIASVIGLLASVGWQIVKDKVVAWIKR